MAKHDDAWICKLPNKEYQELRRHAWLTWAILYRAISAASPRELTPSFL
jgi:hypothetical protein